MLNVHFFPSKQIAFYMARMFVLRTLAVLAGLVVILQTLDLLGQSGKILAHAGNGESELWQYVMLRVPQLVARFLPFSVLLGTLITLATLNQNSEIVSMKAAGISAHQIIAPLILASLAVAGVNFLFNERVVTSATAMLNDWRDVRYGPIPRDTGISHNVWVHHEGDLFSARQVSGRGAAVRLTDVTIYHRDGGTLGSIVRAESAVPAGAGWRLRNARSFDVAVGTTMTAPTLLAGVGVAPDQFTFAKVDADEQDFFSLQRTIAHMQTAARDTTALEAGLWHKISLPLSSVLMPLLAAVAAFGLARSGHLFLRAVIGMALGFTFFVADNVALAMGNLGAYPPLLAAWAPLALFFLVGETILIRSEE